MGVGEVLDHESNRIYHVKLVLGTSKIPRSGHQARANSCQELIREIFELEILLAECIIGGADERNVLAKLEGFRLSVIAALQEW